MILLHGCRCVDVPEISSWYVTSQVPGTSTMDEEVEDTTTIAVLTAPRFVLVTQIHDDEDTNTTVVHDDGDYCNEDRMIIRWCLC